MIRLQTNSNIETTPKSLKRIASAATDSTSTDVPPAGGLSVPLLPSPTIQNYQRRAPRRRETRLKVSQPESFFSFSGANSRLPGLEEIMSISEREMQYTKEL